MYVNLLTHTEKVSRSVDVSKYLFYDAEVQKNDMWSDHHYIKSVQSDGDLGHRMSSAFKSVLTMESKAVIIGSDCPQMSKDSIERALLGLDNHDVVIGPTFDGGYYLLGMKVYHRELFHNIEWSSLHVYNSTIKAIKDKNLSYLALEKMHDLDNKEDLDRFPIFMA